MGFSGSSEARNLRGFVSGSVKLPRDPNILGQALLWSISQIDDTKHELKNEQTFQNARTLRDEYLASGEAPAVRFLNPTPTLVATFENALTVSLKLSAAGLNSYHDRVFDPDSKFAVENEEKERWERYYLCYRHHTKPGEVVKSHLVIKGKDKRYPGVLRFSHHHIYDTREPPYKTIGVVLPMLDSVYLLGAVDGGTGLTQVAMDTLVGDHSLTGLFQSFDEARRLICGRILLKPTHVSRTDEGRFGVLPPDEAMEELGSDFGKIRNYLPFDLNSKIYRNNKEIDQSEIVDLVSRRLHEEENPILTYKDGLPFNPAATNEYTFNTALGAWSASEPGIRGPRWNGEGQS